MATGSSTGVPARSAARTPHQLRHRASAIAKNPRAPTTPIRKRRPIVTGHNFPLPSERFFSD